MRARREHSGERAVVSLLRPHGMLPLVAALPACWFLFIALRRIRPRRSVSPTSDTSSASSNVTVIAISPAVVVASLDPRSRQCPDPTASFFVLACRASSTGARPTREGGGGGGGGCCSGWFRHDTGMVVVSSRRLVRRARRARPSCIQSSLNGTRRNRYHGAIRTRRGSQRRRSKVTRPRGQLSPLRLQWRTRGHR